MSGRAGLTREQAERLGNVIERLRTDRGLSVNAAAQRCNISAGYWSGLEHGSRRDRPDPPRVSEGVLLQIVWHLALGEKEQRELFDAAAMPELATREVPALNLQAITGLESYSLEELRDLEDEIAVYRLGKRKTATDRQRRRAPE